MYTESGMTFKSAELTLLAITLKAMNILIDLFRHAVFRSNEKNSWEGACAILRETLLQFVGHSMDL